MDYKKLVYKFILVTIGISLVFVWKPLKFQIAKMDARSKLAVECPGKNGCEEVLDQFIEPCLRRFIIWTSLIKAEINKPKIAQCINLNSGYQYFHVEKRIIEGAKLNEDDESDKNVEVLFDSDEENLIEEDAQ